VAKKLWKKPSIILINIGKCRYCQKEMTNAESFVAFHGGTYAHFDCDRKEYYQQLINKEKDA